MTFTSSAVEEIVRLVGVRTGLSLNSERVGLDAAMRRAASHTGVTDFEAYPSLLAANGSAMDDLVDELTVEETYFFREPGHFDVIRREVLPEIRARRGLEHTIRAWSAACASGEESYSLAILFDQEGLGLQSHILATDISNRSLARARRASYGNWSLRGDSAPIALPWLNSSRARNGKGHGDAVYQLDEKIRQRVKFAHLNLALDVYPSFTNGTWALDLILCRNVLIYFDRDTVRRVADRLFHSLADGGWLLTASSDPPLWDDAPFQVVTRDQGIFYRRPEMQWPVTGDSSPVIGMEIMESGRADEEEKKSRREEEKESRAESISPVHPSSPVAALTPPANADESVLHVRALANLEPRQAEQACAEATVRYPLSAELQYLHAVLLIDLGRDGEAISSARKVVYLDRSLAVAHFALGSLLSRRGDHDGARRSFRNVRDLCAARPHDEPVPLAEGECAGRLAEIAEHELSLLEMRGEP